MLSTQITFAASVTTPADRGSGRCEVLYGSADPAKNRSTINALAMTDEERYQAGFDDGFNNRGTRGSLYHYAAYSEGWSAGRAARF